MPNLMLSNSTVRPRQFFLYVSIMFNISCAKKSRTELKTPRTNKVPSLDTFYGNIRSSVIINHN